MHLQMAHQDMRDVLTKTEAELYTANRKLLDQKKDLEAKLAKSEEICAKLFESGMYWRQKRFAKENTRIRVPIKGGGKKKTKKKSHGSSLPASGAGSALSLVPTAASLTSSILPSVAALSDEPGVGGAGETPGSKSASKIRVERKPKSVHVDPFTNQFF